MDKITAKILFFGVSYLNTVIRNKKSIYFLFIIYYFLFLISYLLFLIYYLLFIIFKITQEFTERIINWKLIFYFNVMHFYSFIVFWICCCHQTLVIGISSWARPQGVTVSSVASDTKMRVQFQTLLKRRMSALEHPTLLTIIVTVAVVANAVTTMIRKLSHAQFVWSVLVAAVTAVKTKTKISHLQNADTRFAYLVFWNICIIQIFAPFVALQLNKM